MNIDNDKVTLPSGEKFYLSDLVAKSGYRSEDVQMNELSGKVYNMELFTKDGFMIKSEIPVLSGTPSEEEYFMKSKDMLQASEELDEILLAKGFQKVESGHILDATKIRGLTSVIIQPIGPRQLVSTFEVLLEGGGVILMSRNLNLYGLNVQEQEAEINEIHKLHKSVDAIWL